MDIRSLIDSDASGSAPKAPATSLGARKESVQHFKPPDQFRPSQETHQGFHDRSQEPQRPMNRGNGIEPPQVPPLRQHSHDEFRSPSASSYNSIQSPYQKTPSSALSNSQYPFPQPSIHSPIHGVHSTQYYQHEGQPFSMNTSHQGPNQPSSLPQTPTSGTLGGSYPPFQQHRPPSSHSASTPTSGHTQTPTFFRDSPQETHAQLRGQNYSNPTPQYLSQPGTPLGPPTTLGRQSSSRRHESPSSYTHKRTNSGGSHGQHQQTIQSPSSAVRSQSGVPPALHDPMNTQAAPQQNMSIIQDRERSLSVSPKTRLPSQPQLNINATAADHGPMLNPQVTGAKRKMGDPRVDEPSFQQQASAKRSMSLGVGGMLNASHDDESSNQRNLSHAYRDKFAHQPPHSELPSPVTERSSTSNQGNSTTQPPTASAGQGSLVNESPVQQIALTGHDRHPSHEPSSSAQPSIPETAPIVPSPSIPEHASSLSRPTVSTHEVASSNSSLQAPNRRRRYRPGEVPIFAQSWRQKGRDGAHINGQRKVMGKSPSVMNRQPPAAVPYPPLKEETMDGELSNTDGVFSHHLDPLGVLGPWEPTITDVIPAEELTRTVMDYLIHTVVQMNGVAFGPAGGSTTGRGAVVEIEAKIGQIIDQNTNDRLRLPVETECALSRNDPNLRTQFRSSMTVGQHSRLNQFLNRSLQDSKPPLKNAKKPRLPLDYVHTYETDTFYSLSPNALSLLPPSIQHHLDRRNKPKVRITTDQRTGQVTAKIIKVRISNIEVYCPQTAFDWRLSVSLEVNWDGDLRDLVESTEGMNGRSPDRNKDRMSYKHSHYRIDLTQVKLGDIGPKAEKEHELEVELSSAAVREQGQLVLQQKPNNYEGLVKGFVDNVRLLVRQCRE